MVRFEAHRQRFESRSAAADIGGGAWGTRWATLAQGALEVPHDLAELLSGGRIDGAGLVQPLMHFGEQYLQAFPVNWRLVHENSDRRRRLILLEQPSVRRQLACEMRRVPGKGRYEAEVFELEARPDCAAHERILAEAAGGLPDARRNDGNG